MKLDLPTLDFRRKRGRMIEVYKILNGVYDKRVTGGMLMENDRITRGNQRKLVVQEENINEHQHHREHQQEEIISL